MIMMTPPIQMMSLRQKQAINSSKTTANRSLFCQSPPFVKTRPFCYAENGNNNNQIYDYLD